MAEISCKSFSENEKMWKVILEERMRVRRRRRARPCCAVPPHVKITRGYYKTKPMLRWWALSALASSARVFVIASQPV